jgi:hypothetical protein
VTPQIVGIQFDSHLLSELSDYRSRSAVTEFENPVVLSQFCHLYVSLESIGYRLRQKDRLGLLATLWIVHQDLSAIDILDTDIEHFANPGSAPCLQFQKKPVPQALAMEDHLVDGLLRDNLSLRFPGLAEGLSHQRRIQWVGKVWLVICDDEIEKGFQLRVAVSLGGLRCVFCHDFHKMEEVFASDWSKILISEKDLEVVQQVSIANHSGWSEI